LSKRWVPRTYPLGVFIEAIAALREMTVVVSAFVVLIVENRDGWDNLSYNCSNCGPALFFKISSRIFSTRSTSFTLFNLFSRGARGAKMPESLSSVQLSPA
jgi:hypothetical protein